MLGRIIGDGCYDMLGSMIYYLTIINSQLFNNLLTAVGLATNRRLFFGILQKFRNI